jgi:hypothetical protein
MKMYDAWGYKHYDGVLWYPRISVYDRKFGWTTDQHLGREFYGDFGTFDVELTFASNYILDATGNLINREEVMPAELRQKLDIKNFANKPWGSKPSEIIPYNPNERKTWKFHAENVHDFAFTADPTYRIGEAEWNGVKCISLAQEPHAAGWQNAAEYTALVIKTYSEDIGMYVYHKMIVADARDGMEYPMLTLDGGYDPEYRGLLAHEIGHNWFYGQVGSNETYRASLDEGFTQFLTAWAQEKIDGDTIVENPERNWYTRKFVEPNLVRYRTAYRTYLVDAIRGNDPQLNTHSDGFNGALQHGGGYRQVYYKTATMLYNLQYVLGDELFLKSMQHYFNQWKIAHPYYEDFRNSIINYTGADLNWFFDQWLETSKTIDYSVKSVKKGKQTDEYKIVFERKERMHMPIDFSVYSKDGKEYKFYIPNTWFEKKTDATILPRWIGWDLLKPTYEATVTIPGGIDKVQIDPSNRLADINMLDNTNTCPVDIKFDSRIYNFPDNKVYPVYIRPEIWYNGYDGVKAGIHMNGNYMEYKHKFDLTVWYNTGVGQQSNLFNEAELSDYDKVNFRFNYSTATDKFVKGSSFFAGGKLLDGLWGLHFGIDKKSESEKSRVYAYFKSMYRNSTASLNYLLYPEQWNAGMINNTLNVGIDHNYKYVKGDGKINLNFRTSALGSDYNYSAIKLSVVNTNNLGKFVFKTRTFAQYGLGAFWAPESQLYFAGANPEELMENKYTRSVGFIPTDWVGAYGTGINNFHMGGGIGLRGYAGYLVAQETLDGDVRTVYKGTSGASVSGELEFGKLIGISPRIVRNIFKFTPYLFGDAGVINMNTDYERFELSSLRADAGIGTTLSIQKWGPLEMVNPLVIRFDMPLVLNRIPATEDEFFRFRYLIGISRAF